MPHRTFLWFVLPSVATMVLFILVPLVNVGYQSFFSEPERIRNVVEVCTTNFLTQERTCEESITYTDVEGPSVFQGLKFICGRSVLACEELADGREMRTLFCSWWSESCYQNALNPDIGEPERLMNLNFYAALSFTLFYTFITLPFIIIFGLAIASLVNSLSRRVRGPIIFASLLPFIVTPLVGSLVLFWMTGNNGGLLYSLVNWFAFWTDADISLRASSTATWTTLAVYGIWHVTPFAFLVFYAGLQTVSQDQLEAAMVDGATRWERFRHVVVPHLMPLITFVLLIHIMDAFRVLEPIVSFQAQSKAQSLSTLIYEHLVIQQEKRYGTAAATSLLTIVMVFILLLPVLIQTWRDFRGAAR